MQQVVNCTDIKQSLNPTYHPAANPKEHINSDIKVELSVVLGTEHFGWKEALASVLFALNTAVNTAT